VLSPEFVKIARCLHTGGSLRLVEPSLVRRLNKAVAQGKLKNTLGQPVSRPFDDALINEAGELLYPVIRDIPVLLRDEAIDLRQLAEHDETTNEGARHE
jgi:uncharacterized protein YbaR (Trm112 family)